MFSTELDNKELEKQLSQTKKKIASLEESISQKKSERSPLAEQAKKLSAELDTAKGKLYEMQSASKGLFSSEQIADQKQNVTTIQAQWNKAQGQVESYDRQIQKAASELERQKDRAGELTAQIAEVNAHTSMMAPAVAKAEEVALFPILAPV